MPDSMVTLITSSEVRRLPNFKIADSEPEVPILAAILNFRLNSVSKKVGFLCTSEKYVPEIVEVAAGILFLGLSAICQKFIKLLPVWHLSY